MLVRNREPEDLRRDIGLVLALMKAIEITGEAASKVTVESRDAHADVPWAEIVGMRNRLVHLYFDINPELLWKTVIEDLPPLAARLEAVLKQDPDTAPQ
jgi:uncharacterized protein with HEPN domain